jgi:hypothetical protein
MAKTIGFHQGSDGNLYEAFDDGTRILRETGYQARMDAFVAKLNSTTNNLSATTTATATANKSSPSVTATPATIAAAPTVFTSRPAQVKSATKDIILFDDGAIPVDLMADLIFEDIGGQELISIARRDTVNGQKITYQPIKNLSSIEQEYNPNNIIRLQATADKYFANFPIKLDDKVPQAGTGTGGSYVYIDPISGNLIVESVNLESDEQVEIQIATSGTIYETDFNEGAS